MQRFHASRTYKILVSTITGLEIKLVDLTEEEPIS
jgi:hypothetical protein